jgi:hypothetical protein
MWCILFIMSWAFTAAAASYDAVFAWHYRAAFLSWELNPAMRWLEQAGGLETVFGIKLAGLLLATGLACYCYRRHQRLARSLTLSIAGVHGLLMIHYAMGSV